jgi:hypothetical protein
VKTRRAIKAAVAATVLVAGVIVTPLANDAANATPFNFRHLNAIQKRLVSGALAYQLAPPGQGGPSTEALPPGDDDGGAGADGLPNTPPNGFAGAGSSGTTFNYLPHGSQACAARLGSNIKVNQNCLNVSDPALQGRGQANNETAIAQDPLHPNHLVASDNDYVRGDGTCGASYSNDRGRSWNDSTVPNGFTGGLGGNARQYWEAGGDTSVAWDTRGNAYLSCQLFNRGIGVTENADQSSAFVVFRSTGNGGASWNFPGRYVSSFFDPAGAGDVLLDKQLMTVDNNLHSPFRDRVYVTWTEFAADGTGYIYGSHSRNYGETFSPKVVVSKTSALCTNTYDLATPHGTCNENQDSDPFVGPDGSLYVVWENFNNTVTGKDNRNQMLLAKSTDGGVSFSRPVKVSDFYDLPDCLTYQGDDAGRACVPEKGSSTRSVFRANNYPSGAVNPRNPNEVAVTFGSYINRYSNESNGCVPNGLSQFGQNRFKGVKKAGACNNDILLSVSTNAGGSFTGTTTDPRNARSVTAGSQQRSTDQFWQWNAYTQDGQLAVSYFDRQYGSDEFNGSSDITVSSSGDLTGFNSTRVTSSSMPPPTQFYGTKGGLFYGDYMTLTATQEVHPIWMDTRGVDVFICPGTSTGPGNPPQLCSGIEPNGQTANDQDVYTATVQLDHG